MKAKIIEMILPSIVNALLMAFPDEQIKRWLDGLIDIIEEKISESDSRVDDAMLPVLKALRGIFNIPDYEDA